MSPTLKLKNRYEASFRLLIKQARTLGGMPDYFSVPVEDAVRVLREMSQLGRENTSFEVHVNEPCADVVDPRFAIFRGDLGENIKALIRLWLTRKISIRLDGIEVLIELPKKAPAGKPSSATQAA